MTPCSTIFKMFEKLRTNRHMQSSHRCCLLLPTGFVIVILLVSAGGCQRLGTQRNFPPPPGVISYRDVETSSNIDSGSPGAVASGVDNAKSFRAARPQDEQTTATLKSQGPVKTVPADMADMIVRGQDQGGFIMPQLPEVSADGGRHSRDPMPVSSQGTKVAQSSPNGSTGSTQQIVQAQATSGPNPYAAGEPLVPADQYAPPIPYNNAPPPPQSTYNSQPPIDTYPQIREEDLGAVPNIVLPYQPNERIADITVNGYPARTGKIMFGGAVNSDAGVTGQFTIEERNFDITRFPNSFRDLIGGTAFRGAGQTLRIEAVPGNQFQRYSINFTEPFIFGYMPISMSLSAFLFDRRYQDWDEERMGGRINFGYRITPDLSISAGVRGEQVEVTRPRVLGVEPLDAVLGKNDIYSGQLRLSHDTRNSPFAASEGHLFEFNYEQAFGDFDFPKFDVSYNQYFLVRERADGSGRQTLTAGFNVGTAGEDTPIFENFFAGGYTTLRGFEFRGASPTIDGVQVGGRFQFLGTFEYMFPLTADDMLRAVAFVDYGTVERDIELNSENFRVSPGFGLRIAVPALGPAPLAFDFAFPVSDAFGDQQQTFSFYMGLNRKL